MYLQVFAVVWTFMSFSDTFQKCDNGICCDASSLVSNSSAPFSPPLLSYSNDLTDESSGTTRLMMKEEYVTSNVPVDWFVAFVDDVNFTLHHFLLSGGVAVDVAAILVVLLVYMCISADFPMTDDDQQPTSSETKDNIENEQITEPISEGVSKENLKEVEAVKVEIVEQVVEIVEQVVEKSEDIEDYDDKKIITKEPHRRPDCELLMTTDHCCTNPMPNLHFKSPTPLYSPSNIMLASSSIVLSLHMKEIRKSQLEVDPFLFRDNLSRPMVFKVGWFDFPSLFRRSSLREHSCVEPNEQSQREEATPRVTLDSCFHQ